MRRPISRARTLIPDQQYSSILVSRLINVVMRDGKKSSATRIVYQAMDSAATQAKKTPLEVLDAAIANAGPTMELKSRRVGGANYQVPIEVRPERRIQLALRWMVDAARSGKGRDMEHKLADEFLNAFKNEGTAVKKKQDMHRMAEANRAFAHFAWGRKSA
ncbi:MAG TPA: 30S ribosomal protein S7 [Candidatus Paceibacterota bacterium]|nr:30S ribosomal protein S7 [Candidatus Paceibacterota bacterium]